MELAVGASEATLGSLLSKLGSLLAEEYSLIRGVRGNIQFINDELASMQCFLSYLSSSDEGHDDQTEGWMKQVRDVAYDIEDCVDDFAHNLDPDPLGNDCCTTIHKTLYEIRTWKLRRDIAAKIAELKERAQHVGDRRGRYGVPDPKPGKKKSNLGGATGYLAAEHQETIRQLIRVLQPVGVKEMPDLEKWISSDENRKQRGVLSIVGFGGVGKTTVAMALYRKLGPQFQCRAMVTVSQNADPEVVLKDILSQVKTQTNNGEQQSQDSSRDVSQKKIPVIGSILSRFRLPSPNEEEDGIARQDKHNQIKLELENYLRQTRYLLLIDDVWSSSTWQNIKKCFPENENGSRIIVTTRFQAVAVTCSSRKGHDRIHPVEVLLGDEPAKLFHKTLLEHRGTGGGSQPGDEPKKLFHKTLLEHRGTDGGSQPGDEPEQLFLKTLLEHRGTGGGSQTSLNKIPPRVWEICGGLPLAIVTMAGLAASKPLMSQNDWLDLCKSLFPEPEKCRKPEDFMRIINYCYNDMPSDIKICSLYLSIFPKGRKVSRKRLIRRWIAEGYVREKQGLSVEDVAETCFSQLIERKIIWPVEHSSNGRVKSCQVHDMVLEFIISRAAEEDFVTVVGSHWSMPTRSSKVRRLSLHNSDPKRTKSVDRMNMAHVRSLTVFGSLDKLHFKSLKTELVQVLDLEGCIGLRESHFKVSDICKMIQLKYLSLRRTDIKELPPNVSKLRNLETLDIRETEVQQLPVTVGQLERINNILGGDKRTRKTLKIPAELKGTMKTLRMLSGIEIVEGSTTAADIGSFTGLRKLAIYRIHKSDETFRELLSSIQYLSGYSLQTLIIDDKSSEFFKTLDSMSSYPTDLRTLELSGKLLKLPKWIKSLEELVKLTLSGTGLRTDNLRLLSNLSSLFALTFSISKKHDPAIAAILDKNKSDSGGEIIVPAGGFTKLKLLRIFVPLLPSLNFTINAMPQVEKLELRFKRLEGLHGMDKLEMLQDVVLTVDSQASELTKSRVECLKNKEGTPSSKYTLIANEYHD